MKRKVTDEREAKELFERGKISKTSYWRFKKRGWVMVDYHTPSNLGNKLNDDEKVELYKYIFYIALNYSNTYLKKEFFSNLKDIAGDITHDVWIMLLERGFDFKKAKNSATNMIKQVAQRNKLYNNMFHFADSLCHKGSRVIVKSFDDLLF
jgi:hypothetical protein